MSNKAKGIKAMLVAPTGDPGDPEMVSTCCTQPLLAAWVWEDYWEADRNWPEIPEKDRVLVGVCSACNKVDVRTNPETLACEKVHGGDVLSRRPRQVIARPAQLRAG